jgi:hypothetical protein
VVNLSLYRCPNCGSLALLEWQECTSCAAPIGFHFPSLTFAAAPEEGVDIDGRIWKRCVNWGWECNWLAPTESFSDQCFSCLLTRRKPDASDTIARELMAETSVTKRRLLVQLRGLGLPVTPYYEREGGLAFDLLLSSPGNPVTIGHANGVITIDLAESLDVHRERLRVKLGEPYRTMLGHFRHEVAHYYQNVLVDSDERWDECRALFGDERASYSDAITRHYNEGAPDGWEASYISEYATMHPWEDFAETFAHYLHITGTLLVAAMAGMVLAADRSSSQLIENVVPDHSYAELGIDEMLNDWHWLSLFFNRVNRAMGQNDLYPFELVAPVKEKLAFVHRLITAPR